MRYNSLNKSNVKLAKIPLLDGGLSLFTPAEIGDNQLTVATNVEFMNGKLLMREGINADKKNVLDSKMVSGARNYDYVLTNTKVHFGDDLKRVVYAKVSYDESNDFIFVYLLSADRQNTPIGYLHFQRMDDSTFYAPEKIVFYSGKAQTGAGIFAFVTLKNKYNELQKEYVIYEVSSTLDSWNRLHDYYVPTVYINGRGDMYETAKTAGSAVTTAPKTLESPNLLNGRFYAYYTSDGYSTSFRLPYTHIANEVVTCRIYYNLTSFTDWVIYPNETSDKQTLFGAEITANVDREKGIVYFTASESNFAVPVINIYRENNIRISAKTNQHDNFEKVVSANIQTAVGSEIVFSGGENNNEIYYTTFDNPLYFPKVTENLIGFNKTPITALSAVGEKVICYKPDGIYTLVLKKKAPINTTALLIDNNSLFYNAFEVDIDCLSDKVGCDSQGYVCNGKTESVFLGSTQKLYKISLKTKQLEEFSDKIQQIISSVMKSNELKSVFETDKYYVLSFLHNAVIINKDKDETAYIWGWDRNLNIIDGFTQQNNTVLLCCNDAKTICYAATFMGDADKFLDIKNGVLSEIKNKIRCDIKTKEFTLGSFDCKTEILTVSLELKAKSRIRLTFLDRGKTLASFFIEKSDFAEDTNYIKIPCFFHGVSTFQIKLEAEKEFSLGKTNIYYTEMLR